MWKIKKEFHFSASHQLFGLASDHPCGRLHGHNYVVTVCLASDTLNENGFVQDYGELSAIKNYIDSYWDHRHLNDMDPFNKINPSAENMARFLFDHFIRIYPKLYSISVNETPKTTATYYGE